ncbi:MAG: SusD/RagB family nutrient-binding outer membrane lipoprotein, partial [Flavobacteriales bacterium]
GALDSSADLSTAPTAADVANHSAAIAAAFNADSTGGWNVLGQEFFTALYGNGIDAYNFYRRTGFPNNLQPSLEAQPGAFIRSVFYSANFVNNNSSVQQKADQTQQVFWDTNPASPAFPLSN